MLAFAAAIALSAPLALQPPGSAPSPTPMASSLAASVQDVLIAKCAGCHGSRLERPKGEFALADDLKTLAATPDFVAPGKPAESLLWYVIEAREMPPRSSRAGPLSDEQKTAIFAWIEAGAPAPADGEQVRSPAPIDRETPPTRPGPVATGTTSPRPSPADGAPKPPPGRPARPDAQPPFDPIEFAGRFHVVVVHFPIALLMAGALAELWAIWRWTPGAVAIVRFCLTLGALSAVCAAGLGWLHALEADEPLFSVQGGHRWLGTGVAALSLVVVMLNERDVRLAERRSWVRLLILLQAGLVGFVGHLGGMITHGTSYFDL